MNEKEIFEQAYVNLNDAIFRYIYFRIFDRDIAKDLTQETFYRVWDYIAQGKKIDNIQAFLYRTAHNIVVNTIRSKKIILSIDELEETIGFDVRDKVEEEFREQTRDVASILDSFKILKEKDAELMRMRYVDGLSIEEMSKITKYSVNNISVKIHRLIEKLKEYHAEK